jgi:hypothetical protein
MAKRLNSKKETVTLHSKWYDYKTTIVTANDQLLVPLRVEDIGDARIEAMADLYRLFRFDSLKVTFYNPQAAELGVVGFSPGIIAAPTTSDPVFTMDKVAVFWPIQVVPTTLTLTQKDLRGPLPWYYTVGQSSERFDVPGTLIMSTVGPSSKLATAGHLACIFDAVITFKDRVSAGMSFHPRDPSHSVIGETDSKQNERFDDVEVIPPSRPALLRKSTK